MFVFIRIFIWIIRIGFSEIEQTEFRLRRTPSEVQSSHCELLVDSIELQRLLPFTRNRCGVRLQRGKALLNLRTAAADLNGFVETKLRAF